MTAARQTISTDQIFGRIGYTLREAARWTLKAVLAIAIVFMAGVIAVITAAAGLIIAAVAVLLKLTTGKAGPRRAQYAGGETDESGITLEAHRTARGWTVEPR
ncbi:MAG: hypothetical protein CME84_05195 [Henriciella sp.]|jgi:hypothetical protein|uniref:hypothetical protein n=1 Tax=Henriciella sp. TaxID=1968823 RepID=UPI000C0CABD6|nr:hypothetical protein [Henriciella sp.]MAN73469.1 hypothetical protein [Henriciella sp.]MBF34889.1 hypothetical protein [Hyphomonadaceae bacterium]PHR78766.1 MAG: hypothetical protein COA64_07235 [Henriciella sp.]|tara:strand:+ start:3976 stop:4284 length:309 start_codon:yes stop_codon:yes gene_type:complete